MTNFDMLVIYPVKEMLAKVAGFIPVLASVLFILIVGSIAAKILKDVAHYILKAIRFDSIAHKIGLADILDNSGIKLTVSEVLGAFVYWTVMVITLILTANAVGLTVVAELLDRLFAYVPSVLSAVFILALGMFLAYVIAGFVYVAAKNTHMPDPELLGKVSRYAIVFYAAKISLEELGIVSLLEGTTFYIIFGAVFFALALAFGLGGKDAASRYIDDLRKKRS